MTSPETAARLGTTQPKIAQIESGRTGVSEDRLRTFAAACRCENDTLVHALVEMAGERTKGWWEQYRDALPTGFLEIAEMEHHARRITCASSVYIPGVFQTVGYASAVFSRILPPLPRHEADIRTAFRIQRQQKLRAAHRPVTAYVHEAALRMQFGGPAVLHEQLEFLLEESARPEVTIRAIPFTVDGAPGAGADTTYAHGLIPELDTVEFDIVGGPMFRDTDSHLATYRTVFERTDRVALPEEATREFISDIAGQLERKP